jgi:hypothetical protein
MVDPNAVASETRLAPTAVASRLPPSDQPHIDQMILIQGVPVEPKRPKVSRGRTCCFDLPSRGKPYLRGEGCP